MRPTAENLRPQLLGTNQAQPSTELQVAQLDASIDESGKISAATKQALVELNDSIGENGELLAAYRKESRIHRLHQNPFGVLTTPLAAFGAVVLIYRGVEFFFRPKF